MTADLGVKIWQIKKVINGRNILVFRIKNYSAINIRCLVRHHYFKALNFLRNAAQTGRGTDN
ncbi:hypothetical protein [Okeania sp. KiyG1]|uniref:hypothetical protein n=1 Tax=Okeania sp. KiyG1 TaxID=2720165 RepID=UPI001921D27E|nr:hypothetical protein [Okeania sp. KiyG1]